MKSTNKIGIVKCNKRLIYDDKDVMKLFFSNFFPYEIKFDLYDNVIFHCFSEHFDGIKEGDKIPSYEVFINYMEDGKIIINKVCRTEKTFVDL